MNLIIVYIIPLVEKLLSNKNSQQLIIPIFRTIDIVLL